MLLRAAQKRKVTVCETSTVADDECGMEGGGRGWEGGLGACVVMVDGGGGRWHGGMLLREARVYLFIYVFFMYVLVYCLFIYRCKFNVCGAWHCKGITPMPSPRLSNLKNKFNLIELN